MIRTNKLLCVKSGSNAQHGHHAHKCSKIFSGISGQFFMKLGMSHQVT